MSQQTKMTTLGHPLLKPLFLASASAIAMTIAAPAMAQDSLQSYCTNGLDAGVGTDCEIPADADIDVIKSTSTVSSDNATYTFKNDADLDVGPNDTDEVSAFYLQYETQDGSSSNDNAVNGLTIDLTNNGTITVDKAGEPSGTSDGFSGIHAWGIGGKGRDANSNANGGRGGDGAVVSVDNYGDISIIAPNVNSFAEEMVGITVRSQGGDGGAQSSGSIGDVGGGDGGDAKAVTVTNSGTISIGTPGTYALGRNGAKGIAARALGGNGGPDGGPDEENDESKGYGGSGGTVTITNSGEIDIYYNETASGSDGIHGIYAQSQGGDGAKSNDNSDNGGNGEYGRPVTVTNDADITIDTYFGPQPPQGESGGIFAVSYGGEGGESAEKSTGGAGGGATVDTDNSIGTVTITNNAAISVVGNGFRGIVSRTQGGDAGDGEDKGDDSIGGNGGFGGNIDVVNNGSITTNGENGYAVLGQSIGGIGGSGRSKGGTGGDGGEVNYTGGSSSTILTTGDYAAGVTLHSLGGGGGVGDDFVRILSGGGGQGGTGGSAGSSVVASQTDITTSGYHAYGILAQSIGGSGGSGGIGTGLVTGLGGDGGNGGTANAVQINNSGAIATSGDYAAGLIGQSIAGGGGSAGMGGGILSVGGSGGSGADNDTISYIANSGDITTTGAAAVGILMQAIGGGGGNGGGDAGLIAIGGSGSAGGRGGKASVFTVNGTISTAGDHAYGAVAQSVGGGGGNGGDVLDISAGAGLGIGGSGSSGGGASFACVANQYNRCPSTVTTSDAPPAPDSNRIVTTGDFSHGVIAQAVGGGGGNGGDLLAASAVSFASVQIGGFGSGGGSGGVTTVDFTGLTLSTSGNNARGIMAQSLGGGGGNGGNVASVAGLTPLALVVGGGSGGGGGANYVNVNLDESTVSTVGSNASAILAQSIGGGGGTGGLGFGFAGSAGFTAAVSFGGSGGLGGEANAVAINVTDSVVSTGIDRESGDALLDAAASSHGIVAQSVGGGGGTGGSSFAGALTAAIPTPVDPENPVGVSATFAMGGGGGGGGDGYNSGTGQNAKAWAFVQTEGDTTIQTGGSGSHGILAQSIGGGGGDGGAASVFSGTISYPGATTLDIGTSLGGSGKVGGAGGAVKVALNDTSSVVTLGDNANGVVAQSIGGGGGEGGVGNAVNDKIGRGLNFDVDIGLGGSGGAGGTSGTVTVDMQSGATIRTSGLNSKGIVAQSIAGGGGTGQGGTVGFGFSGFSPSEYADLIKDNPDEVEKDDDGKSIFKLDLEGSIELNVGANGAAGGTAGNVIVITKGAITTTGDGSDGILAQSVGGGGGVGGSAGSDSVNRKGYTAPTTPLPIVLTGSLALNASVGGRGGTGGHAGTVQVTNLNTIRTSGDHANGIIAQSIGGGGGQGGVAVSPDSEGTFSGSLAVGGSGGAGGDGKDVTMTFDDSNGTSGIVTSGYAAHGALIQSIGGGGGHGAAGTAAGGAKVSLTLGVGGSGGASGDAGTVTITNGSNAGITTTGDDSYGLLVQSIAGGGGYGAAGSSDAPTGKSLQVGATVGGSGGNSGDAGAVNIDLDGSIRTSGARAFGLVAQSIQGGGGVAGAGSIDNLSSVSIGAQGDTSGSNGTVDVSMNGSIVTEGTGAIGLIAQAIAGGGGIVGDLGQELVQAGPIQTSMSGGSGAGSSAVTVTTRGITTNGDYAHGVVAQSIADGGGIIGGSGGVQMGRLADGDQSAGSVRVNVDGAILTNGRGSIGVFAQSDGGANSNTVTVDVDADVTGGTSASGTGIYVSSGFENVVTIAREATVSSGDEEGLAIFYDGDYIASEGANLTVTNDGTVNGAYRFVDSTGANAGSFINNGSYNPNAPSTGDLVNAGTVDLVAADTNPLFRGRERYAIFDLAGDYRQTRRGRLRVGADFERTEAHRIAVDGEADLDGVLAINAATIAPSDGLTVLSATGDLSGSFEAVDTPAVDYDARTRDDRVELSVAATRFGSAFDDLDRNQERVGDHLDAVFSDGARNGFATLLAEINDLSIAGDGGRSYRQALSSLTLGGAQAIAATQVSLAASRLDGTLTCNGAQGRYVVEDPDRCVWASLGGSSVDQDGTGGYDGDHFGVGGGTRMRFGEDWVFGLAAGLERSEFDAATGLASTDGTTGYLGLSLGRDIGGFSLSAAVTGSFSDFDTTRRLVVPSFEADAEGETEIYTLGGRLRGAYTFDLASAYIRPMVDLDLVHIHASGYDETGAGILNLEVRSEDETAFVATPAVEIGTERALGAGWSLGAFGNGGLSFSTLDDWTSEARFDGASGVGTFRSSVPVPDALGKVGAGVSLANASGFEARLEYRGAFGSDYESHGGLVRFTQGF